MTDSMPERKLSDAFTGINIEESLKSKLSSLGFGEYSSEAKYTEPNNDIGNLSDIADLDLGDTLPSITSESSGVVSGLTSSVHSCANSAGTVPSPRESAMEIQENPSTNHRLKSAMLQELHVYVVPLSCWEQGRNLATKTIENETISLGFVRVLPELNISNLRLEIEAQLDHQECPVPESYIFIRNVGRHFAMVKSRQEQQLKVRNFLPPQSDEPEIFILEQDGYTGNYGAKNGKPPTKIDMLNEVKKLKKENKEGMEKQEGLMSSAKVLQDRINNQNKPENLMARLINRWKFNSKVVSSSGPTPWDLKLDEETRNTEALESDCTSLRNDLDEQHKIRMDSFEIKMKPIIIRDGPSKKANWKIQAAKLAYEIYSLTQRLRYTSFRAENEEKRREQVEREVRILREKISVLKIQISTITKGVPITKIEVREDKRSIARSSSPDEKFRSSSVPTSGKPPERSYSPTMRHTAHGILKSQQSLASEILA